MIAFSLGLRASNSSATRGRPPVMSRVLALSVGMRAMTSPALTLEPGSTEKLGVIAPRGAAAQDVLVKLGVPANDIEAFGDGLKNTHQEVLALRAWAERSGARSIIVPTEIFSARRVRWTLHRAFGSGFLIRVPALDPPGYRRDNWWRHVEGLISFQNETIKYVYYRFKY